MPNFESHREMVGGTRYITMCDAQNPCHQTPVTASEHDKTEFVTQNGKWVFKRLHLCESQLPCSHTAI